MELPLGEGAGLVVGFAVAGEGIVEDVRVMQTGGRGDGCARPQAVGQFLALSQQTAALRAPAMAGLWRGYRDPRRGGASTAAGNERWTLPTVPTVGVPYLGYSRQAPCLFSLQVKQRPSTTLCSGPGSTALAKDRTTR